MKQNPLKTDMELSQALRNGTIKNAVIRSVVKNVVKYATGDRFDKDAVLGTATGEIVQLFGLREGDIAQAGELDKFGATINLTKVN